MNNLFTASIAKAKSLYEGFNDVIHDWEHSERTAVHAHLIADNLGYQDKDLLELCALWHDAARTKGLTDGHEEAGAQMAKADLLQRGADKELAERAYEAIRFHKSTASPVTIEGKIIRDADKLDIFTIRRWEKCAEAGWTQEYVEDLKSTVATMGRYPDAFTYDYTKKLFEEHRQDFIKYYESIKDQLP